jgi:FMN reductase
MKVIGLGGSLRVDSLTYTSLNLALSHIEAQGIDTELIDLRTLHLPFCNGEKEYPDFPDVEILRQKFKSAQGVIIATPEYHGCISGVLKNVFDLLDFEHVQGKVFALIAVLGGEPSSNATNTLRMICRHLHAWVLPQQLLIAHSEQAFNSNGKLRDPLLQQRMEEMTLSFVQSVQILGLHH